MSATAVAGGDGPAEAGGGYAEAEAAGRGAGEFGMWIFIASEAMFFGGLFFAYAIARLHSPAGFAAASRATDVLLGTVNTAVLLTSSFAVALAGEAIRRGARRRVAALLGAAALLGLAFLAVKGVEYRHDWTEGLVPGAGFRLAGPPGAELFFMFYFTATALHALHLLIGIGWLLLLAARAARQPQNGGEPTGPTPAEVEVAGLYWHLVDIVWIFLYPLLYLVARSG